MRQRELEKMAQTLSGIYHASVCIDHTVWQHEHCQKTDTEYIVSVVMGHNCDIEKFATAADMVKWYDRQVLLHLKF